jgi:hypothetical protein
MMGTASPHRLRWIPLLGHILINGLFVLFLGFLPSCRQSAEEEASRPDDVLPPLITDEADYQPPIITTPVIGHLDEERAISLARDYLANWGKDTSLFNLHEPPRVEQVEKDHKTLWLVRWDTVREPRIYAGVEVVVSASGIGADYVD